MRIYAARVHGDNIPIIWNVIYFDVYRDMVIVVLGGFHSREDHEPVAQKTYAFFRWLLFDMDTDDALALDYDFEAIRMANEDAALRVIHQTEYFNKGELV